MPITNAKVADLLRRYAAALALEGVDRFKIKAYRRAAETIESLAQEVADMVAHSDDLTRLPGIGKAISQKIKDIVESGKLKQLEKAIAGLKPELVELSTRPALDPKTVMRVYKKLKINSLAELQERLATGEIRETLGARVDFHIRHGLEERPRMLLYDAEPIAHRLEAHLSSLAAVARVSRVGSLRRKQDTVGDFNFLVGTDAASDVLRHFAESSAVQSTIRLTEHNVLVRLSFGGMVEIHTTALDQWGLSLALRTGATAHLKDLHKRAGQRRLKLSAESLRARKIDMAVEAEIYRALGLEFIEPELREGRGEVAAALKGSLPQLVRYEDLRGDLHMHTTASDGAASIAQMAAAAQKRGYEYVAITDHSQSLKITNGLSEKRLLQQIKTIDRLNGRLKGIVVLKSAEVDIREDGSLDYSNSLLKELDLTICSIHSRFGLNRQQQTERIMRAMDNRYFNILGHATGRLLLKREGYELDMRRIIGHAKQNGCFFEINSSPDRLDLSDEHAKMAKDAGVRIAVNTDAHSIAELEFMHAGLNQARRAWLEAGDVLNTLPLAKLKTTLQR